jgi:hypothetical protein
MVAAGECVSRRVCVCCTANVDVADDTRSINASYDSYAAEVVYNNIDRIVAIDGINTKLLGR